MVYRDTQYQDIDCKGRGQCFDSLTGEELEALEQSKLIIRYEKGEVISKQGTANSNILFLQKGYVKFYKEFPKVRTITLVQNKCNLIGLSGLFIDTIMQNTIVALTDCVVCSFQKTTFEKLIKKNNSFAIATIRNINERSLRRYNNGSNIASKQMHGRMAWALLELSEVFSALGKIILSRKELSEFTNMSVMSVGRMLREFQGDGIIDLHKDSIQIIDKDKLIIACKNG